MAPISYRYCHFPPAIVQHSVWLYARFSLSYRDVEELLAERGIVVSYETIRRWVAKFGPQIARRLRHHRRPAHPQWHLDEMFVSIGEKRMYLWRAIDQNGEILDILVQAKRNKHAALRLMRKLLKKGGRAPLVLVTDKLGSYGAAFRAMGLTGRHHQARWKNNRIEGSHVHVRRRERRMQGFRSPGSAQRFLSIHDATYNTFNTRRHLCHAPHHRDRRQKAFGLWNEAAHAAAWHLC
jgi:transposase-like protein